MKPLGPTPATESSPASIAESRILADRLLRRRERRSAIEVLAAADPSVFETLRAAHSVGASRHPAVPVTRAAFDEAVLMLVARFWRRTLALRPPPHVAFRSALGVFEESGFLPDYYLYLSVAAHPAAACDGLLAREQGLRSLVSRWWRECSRAFPDVALPEALFGRKVVGSVLHHFLRPTRFLGADGRVALAPLSEVVAIVPPRIDVGGEWRSLYLMLAVARGDPAALRRFLADYGPVLDEHLRRLRASTSHLPDLRDEICAQIYLKGCSYFASGSLEGWLWRVAEAELANSVRARITTTDDLDGAGSSHDRNALDAETTERCQNAVRAAFAGLDESDRRLLREHHVFGRTMSDLAREASVSVATISRRIKRVLERVFDRVVERLRVSFDGDPTASLLALGEFRAQLRWSDLDVAALLGGEPPTSIVASTERMPDPESSDAAILPPDARCLIPDVGSVMP